MNFVLFDDHTRYSLFPLTLTRPVAEIRWGILTIREKWEKHLDDKTSSFSVSYLGAKFPLVISDDNILINGAVIPTAELLKEIAKLESGEKLIKGQRLIAMRLDHNDVNACVKTAGTDPLGDVGKVLMKWDGRVIQSSYSPVFLEHSWDIFSGNGDAIAADFALITKGRKSARIDDSNRVSGDQLFVEEGARISHAIINTTSGPVYIGKDAEIMEGSMVRGPFALCEHATLKMGAKIYGPTTIGPYSKIGGEVSNSVVIGYSNKGHDGFIGNSVIGEWCNLGADTNCSNLKNNYGNVKVWFYPEKKSIDTGLQFCGLIMGDHSKSGINTMFNTGTVVGVSTNIFGGGFPPKFIPSFFWGGGEQWEDFDTKKAVEVASRMMERRGLDFTKADQAIFDGVHQISEQFRLRFRK